MSLSTEIRWVGVVIASICLIFILWTQYALRSSYSGTVSLRQEHRLVMTGPYRFLRHPMYVFTTVFMLGIALATSNAFLGFLGILTYTVSVIKRIDHEEQILRVQFGDTYKDYCAITGKMFPKISVIKVRSLLNWRNAQEYYFEPKSTVSDTPPTEIPSPQDKGNVPERPLSEINEIF